MLALLSALGGLLGSFAPEVLKFFKDRADKKHELAVMALQMEASKLGYAAKLEEINVTAEGVEAAAVYQFANPKTGIMEAINAAIRPLITILFVGGYLYSKWPSVPWTETDVAILSAIIGFWFGNRSLKYYLGRTPQVANPFSKK
jgi:hypothetical protein